MTARSPMETHALVSAVDALVDVLIADYGLPPVARRFSRFWLLLGAQRLLAYVGCDELARVQEARRVVGSDIRVRPALLPPAFCLQEISVRLTDADEELAQKHADAQHARAVGRGYADALGNERALKPDLDGARGEIAFAKALCLFWGRDLDGFKGPDVSGYQVRATALRAGCLIVREKDRDGDVFVLVTGLEGHYTVRGWLYGSEAKERGRFEARGRNRRPAYWVPQSQLRPLSTLPDLREWTSERPTTPDDSDLW